MANLAWRSVPYPFDSSEIDEPVTGLELRFGGEQIATIMPLVRSRIVIGWYFSADSQQFGVPPFNSLSTRSWLEQDRAKRACMDYVHEHFKRPSKPKLRDQILAFVKPGK